MTKYKFSFIASILTLLVAFGTFQAASAQLVYVPYGSSSSSSNTTSYSSTDSGCSFGNLYSTTTGRPCSTQTSSGVSTATACLNLGSNLFVGMRDSWSNTSVSQYQNFLIGRGYLAVGLATGYFGPSTLNATVRFQSANGVQSTGYVGPQTRAKISALTCNNTNPVPPINNTGAPTITSVAPTSGRFGTAVTIYGSNFSLTSNSINFGGVNNIAYGIPSYDGVSVNFTIPYGPCAQGSQVCTAIAFAPGQFPISVNNGSGVSNTLYFTATDQNSQNLSPVVSGVDGPTNLGIGQQGTWTVRATDQTGGGLSYQATWGDENQQYGGYYYSSNNVYSQYASFTHTYNQPGTYRPTFVVKGTNGLTAQTSITVVVGGGAVTGAPTISSISPSSGPYGTTVVITGTNFTTSGNRINYAGRDTVSTATTNNTTTLTFVIPATPCTLGTSCAQVVLEPGTYPISVSNQYGTSSSLNFTLTNQSSQNVPPTVSSISPSSISYGTLVTVTGNNFSRYNNSVNFANASFKPVNNIESVNGTTLQFTLESNCTQGQTCSLPPGQYPYTVSNQYGASATNYFNYSFSGGSSANQTFVLGLNQTATTQYNLQITPLSIVEDSRCPADVTCIQAGRVVVQTSIRTNTGQYSTVNLSSNSEEYSIDGNRVKIIAVSPTKYSNQTISNSQYSITYQVIR